MKNTARKGAVHGPVTGDHRPLEKLAEYHLACNESKTENHHVPPRAFIKPSDPNTKKSSWSDMDRVLPETYTEDATWKN